MYHYAVLIGRSLFLLQQKRINNNKLLLIRLFVFMPIIVGIITLLEYILNLNIGIDQLFFKEAPNAMGTLFPNRMPITTAINIIILETALSFIDKKIGEKQLLSQYLFMIVGTIALLFIHYFYCTSIYSVYQITLASPYAVVTLGLICIAGLFARPDKGFMILLSSKNSGSAFCVEYYQLLSLYL